LVLLLSFMAWAQPDAADRQVESGIVDLVNQERRKAGLSALQLKPLLHQVAIRHSEEMSRLGYVSHQSPTSHLATLQHRLQHGLCCETTHGECIVELSGPALPKVAQASVQHWLATPADAKNLLNPHYNRTGVGLVRRGKDCVITQVFTWESIEVIRSDFQAKGSGFQLALECRVVEGLRQGFVLHNGKKVVAWQADEKGHFVSQCEVPGSGKVEIAQKQADGAYLIGAEIEVRAQK
jgi:hypothetical protein